MSELGSGNGTSYPASLDVDNTVEVDSSTTQEQMCRMI